jgi:hypothetical protein
MMPPRQAQNVVRLADHGGDYVLLLKCACGHTRRTGPHLLAHVFGWQALLSEVTKKLRCSSCNEVFFPLPSATTDKQFPHVGPPPPRSGAGALGTRGTPRQAGAVDYVHKRPLLDCLGILVPATDRERISIRLWEHWLCAARLADL